MSRSLKLLTRFLLILLVGLALTLIIWVIVAGPMTVYRIIRFGDTQIDDFKHSPTRQLQVSSTPYRFEEDLREINLPAQEGSEIDPNNTLEGIMQPNDTIAFLVIKGDTLIYEKYFQGHTETSHSQSFSMAKSFTSILIGMAIEDGYIRSIDQPVTDYIPELAPQGFSNVTIKHLLTMTSGSDYIENDNPFGIHVILNYTPNLEQKILSFGIEDEPGQVWRYKSGDNALLALILDRVLDPITISDYTQEKLWSPLGMESDGSWSLDHEGDGLELTWCCLAASARDYAKLGQLYLRNGDWNGQQLVPSEWIQQSTQTAGVTEAAWSEDYRAIGIRNYGYQWWLLSEEEGDYLANGKDGQYLYINPTKNVMILRLGWSMGDLRLSQWLSLFRSISEEIE